MSVAGDGTRAWRGHAGLAGERDAWDALVAESSADALCNSHAWVSAYAAAWVADDELFGWTLTDGAGVPLAIFALRREPPRGRFALPRALLAQDGSFDSDYLEPLIRPGHEAEAWDAFLDAAARDRGVQAVVLGCVPRAAATLGALRTVLADRGLRLREHDYPCAVAALPASFEEYVAGLKSRMRSKVRSSLRRVEARDATLDWCNDPDELPRDLAGLFDLHGRRWRAAGEAGSFAEPRRRAFYEALAPRWLADGELRLARLTLDGRPVAFQIGPVVAGTYYQLQEGYDPELSDLRIGQALRAWAIRSLIDEGVERYDFMAGLSRHKLDWGATERECVTVAFPLPRLRARVAYAARAWIENRRRP